MPARPLPPTPRTVLGRRLVLCIAGLAACTPPFSVGDDEAGVTTSPEGEGEAGGTSEDTTSEDTTSGETSNFILDTSPNIGPCDIVVQDCPEGEKCVPYGSTGGNWDANKCVPVTGDQAPGEPCVWGGLVEATDDCDATSMCWDVVESEDGWTGTCAPFCTGTKDNMMCPPGYSCLSSQEVVIAVCIRSCDPLIQDCLAGLACYWTDPDFRCIFTTQDIPPGEPCGFINDCAAGNVCVTAEVLPECAGSACCVPFCDLGGPDCASLPGTECVPFFERGTGPPDSDHIGVCIVPGP